MYIDFNEYKINYFTKEYKEITGDMTQSSVSELVKRINLRRTIEKLTVEYNRMCKEYIFYIPKFGHVGIRVKNEERIGRLKEILELSKSDYLMSNELLNLKKIVNLDDSYEHLESTIRFSYIENYGFNFEREIQDEFNHVISLLTKLKNLDNK